jgi:hypothetical protein
VPLAYNSTTNNILKNTNTICCVVSYKFLDVSKVHTASILGVKRACQKIRKDEQQHIISRTLCSLALEQCGSLSYETSANSTRLLGATFLHPVVLFLATVV